MYTTIYSFELTELRFMRLEAADEEEFMNIVADFIGKLTEKYEFQRQRAEMAEHQLRVLENNG